MIYAQVNEEHICIGISKLLTAVDDERLILIGSYDTSILGKKYNNGIWEDVEQPKPEPNEAEIIQAEILLNQAEIITKQKEQDEVLAEILLGQQEVAANV